MARVSLDGSRSEAVLTAPSIEYRLGYPRVTCLWLVAIAFLCAQKELLAEQVYRNEAFGYVISYPDNWFPSGNNYSNAFEIRNYDPKKPELVPEEQRATLIIVDTRNDSPEATLKFLDAETGPVTAARSRQSRRPEVLSFGGRRAIRLSRKEAERFLGPGTRSALGVPVPHEPPKFFLRIVTYVANGAHLLAIDSTVWPQSGDSVVKEIIQIHNSLTFTNQLIPAPKGENNP